MEDYDLPILQDTEGDDETGVVFGLYDAYSYDMFIVDRDGYLVYAVVRHPESEYEETLEEILAYR